MPIYRANYLLRAVPVEAGQHRVEVYYDPPLFKVGLAITMLTLSNGFVQFLLDGNAQYDIVITGGDYYCIDTDAVGGDLSPDFYLDVRPA